MLSPVGQTIEAEGCTITEEMIHRFAEAVGTKNPGTPPTFATLFRKAEYEWLNRLGVDLKDLLHGDQEYEYFQPLEAGLTTRARSTVTSVKDRTTGGGKMRWIRVTTEILSGDKLYVIGRTTFVIRNAEEKS